ncbi:histidine kinase [Gorillibacterium sp. sgz500922]|uniref:sensor histidine kinase n=1 Tax=Gorillibacterium sp. sgz500922 TaxID=3446694 RepID=UPI003F6727AE
MNRGKDREPFGSLRLRLLAGFLGAALILAAALLLVQRAETAEAENRVLHDSVSRTQDRFAEATASWLEETRQTAERLAADPLISRLALAARTEVPPGTGTPGTEDSAAVLELLERELDALPEAESLCLVLGQAGRTLCAGAADSALSRAEAAPAQAGFDLVDLREEGVRAAGLRYIRPLTPKAAAETDDFVVVRSLDAFLARMQKTLRATRLALAPESGDTARPERETVSLGGDRLRSERTFFAQGIAWTSSLDMENPLGHRTRGALLATLGVAIFLLAVFGILAFLFLTRQITRPLQQLKSLMNRAERGDLKAYWLGKGSRDIEGVGDSYNQMLNRLEDAIRQVKVEEALKKEAEIEALHNQLNPHFLYNTLSTIKWVAKLNKTPQIADAVSALVRLLQASLGKKGDFLPLREEVSLIRDYMEIQTFRFGEQVAVRYDIEPLSGSCLVPRLILQPLVENALLHGIGPAGGTGTIGVRSYLERDLLVIEVEDDGVGLRQEADAAEEAEAGTGRTARPPETRKQKMTGIGLSHIRAKLKLHYGENHQVLLYPREGGGTKVRLTLPIHPAEETDAFGFGEDGSARDQARRKSEA